MSVLCSQFSKVFVFFLFLLYPACFPIWAAGLLTPKNSDFPHLDIQSHQVNVQIEDGFVTTNIEQVFLNPHSQDLEAIYSFPVPERASVADFSVWIDGTPITGEVLEKKGSVLNLVFTC